MSREDSKSLRRWQSTLLSDLILFKKSEKSTKSNKINHSSIEMEMYRQFGVVPHWRFSSDGNLRVDGVRISKAVSLFAG